MSESAAAVPVALTLDAKGRLTIPQELRQALGVQPGDTLVLQLEESRLVARTRAEFTKWFKAQFADLPALALAGPGEEAEFEQALLESRLRGSGEPTSTPRGLATLRALGRLRD